MAHWFFLLLILLAGAVLPVQAAVNNKMADWVQSPVLATLLSFVVGIVALLAYLLVSGTSLAPLAQARQAPWGLWLGGLLGAFYVVVVVSLAPRLGMALTFTLLVAGQLLATLVIDHYGLLGLPVREINLARLAGIVLVIAGVILIRRF